MRIRVAEMWRGVLSRPPRRATRILRNRMRRMSDRSIFLLVVAFALTGTVWSFLDYSRNVRIAGIAIMSMVFGSLVLGTVYMVILVALLTAGVLTVVVAHDQVSSQLTASGVVMLASVATVSVVQARRRESLGLRRRSAESVLEQVRQRLLVQGSLPELPLGWHVDVAQRLANRAAFAGDFVSARVHDVGGIPYLEVALVDVSGSGMEAGERALLLSGAVGGLLGAVPADRFLDETNRYLRRQKWASGFASASYLRLNLASWEYELRAAGHPPALRWTAAERVARRTATSGVVLGVVDDLGLNVDSGRLAAGDALILYTDGVIDDRLLDLDASIGNLERAVWHALDSGPRGHLAERLAPTHRGAAEDDRTVAVIWNDGSSPGGTAAAEPGTAEPISSPRSPVDSAG